eukprot:1159179-Pelagomonas_calceolata.AAC.1
MHVLIECLNLIERLDEQGPGILDAIMIATCERATLFRHAHQSKAAYATDPCNDNLKMLAGGLP